MKTSEKITFSVIVPVFNDTNGINKLLDSLTRQTYPKSLYEILVVDNNSTDNSKSVITSYKNAKYIFEKKQGSYAARNAGIKAAKNKILAFIDADCLADKNWLLSAVYRFNDSSVSAIAGRIKFVFPNGKPNVYEYVDSAKKLNQEAYTKIGFAATANFLFRREIIEKIGMFDPDIVSGGDYEFGMRMKAQGYRISYCPDVLVFHSARADLRQLLKKTVRVARGQKQLESEGKLNHARINMLSFLPLIYIPRNEYYPHFSFIQVAWMLVIANIIKYRNLYERIK